MGDITVKNLSFSYGGDERLILKDINDLNIINDLYKKVQEGNNLNTYLDFKISKEQLGRDGIFVEDLYPSEEIQVKDVTRGNLPEFIALTEKQKVELKKENLRNFSKFLDIINKSKEVTSEQKTNLEFKYKRNYED